ncbi:MAG: EamA family transporter [Elusimicrobiaceae bacterium]|nr:EamA family transporter [Elusimicrobiaceae bacterium]
MLWASLALLSAVFSAIAAVIEKKILFTEEAVPFSFVFAVVSAAVALPLLHGVDFGAVSRTGLGLLFFKTALGSAAFLFVMESIKRLELSGALPLLALTPALAAVGGLLFLGETLSVRETGGLVTILAGTYLLQSDGKTGLFEPFIKLLKADGYRYILAALTIFAVTSLIDKTAITRYRMKPGAVLGFNQLFQAFCFWAVYLARGYGYRQTAALVRRCGGLIVTLALVSLVYRWAQIEAVRLAPVALVLALKRTSVFMGTAAGGKLFGEHDVPRKSFAAGIIVAGAFLIMNNAG